MHVTFKANLFPKEMLEKQKKPKTNPYYLSGKPNFLNKLNKKVWRSCHRFGDHLGLIDGGKYGGWGFLRANKDLDQNYLDMEIHCRHKIIASICPC